MIHMVEVEERIEAICHVLNGRSGEDTYNYYKIHGFDLQEGQRVAAYVDKLIDNHPLRKPNEKHKEDARKELDELVSEYRTEKIKKVREDILNNEAKFVSVGSSPAGGILILRTRQLDYLRWKNEIEDDIGSIRRIETERFFACTEKKIRRKHVMKLRKLSHKYHWLLLY